MDVGGQTVLARVVRRLSRATVIDETVIATSLNKNDDAIAQLCDYLDLPCFRGSESNVLERYLQAAERFYSDIVVRVTSDCPLIEPVLVDCVTDALLKKPADLSCNDLPPTYPRGLDVEAFTIQALRTAAALAEQPYQREHVTPLMYERPDLFRIVSIQNDKNFSHYRWTLDTAEDLELIRAIYAHFDNSDEFSWRDVIDLVQHNPELATINHHIVQKSIFESAYKS